MKSVNRDKEQIYLHLVHIYSSRRNSELPKIKSDSFDFFYILCTINTPHNINNPPEIPTMPK